MTRGSNEKKIFNGIAIVEAITITRNKYMKIFIFKIIKQ